MFKNLRFIFLFTSILLSQNINQPKYIVYKETTLSTAAEVITIQQPAVGAKIVNFTDAFIYCSVPCNPQVELNGTAATATALTITPGSTLLATTSTTAWSASNVGSGTVVAKFAVPAGTTYPLDLSGIQLSTNNTSKNITIRTDAISGIVRIQLRWIEQ
jgi:hypothetical protein